MRPVGWPKKVRKSLPRIRWFADSEPVVQCKKSQQQKQFMKNITESSDSSKQAYTQPALVELGDLKSETLGNANNSGDGTSAP